MPLKPTSEATDKGLTPFSIFKCDHCGEQLSDMHALIRRLNDWRTRALRAEAELNHLDCRLREIQILAEGNRIP